MRSSESGSTFDRLLDQKCSQDGFSYPSRIVSQLGDDPDLMDLVEDFVAAMPDRIASIGEAVNAQDRLGLQRLMHQLKGACGSYGFPQLTEEASMLEKMLHQGMGMSVVEGPLVDFAHKLTRVATR